MQLLRSANEYRETNEKQCEPHPTSDKLPQWISQHARFNTIANKRQHHESGVQTSRLHSAGIFSTLSQIVEEWLFIDRNRFGHLAEPVVHDRLGLARGPGLSTDYSIDRLSPLSPVLLIQRLHLRLKLLDLLVLLLLLLTYLEANPQLYDLALILLDLSHPHL